MTPQRLDGDRLLVPQRGEIVDGEDAGTLTDSMIEIGPDHPDYAEWLAEVEREEAFEIMVAETIGR